MATVTRTQTLVILECADCYTTFGMAPKMEEDLRRTHRTFYCPAGHRQYFPQESDIEEAQRLRREALQRAEQSEAERRVEAQAAIDARNRARAEKAAKTRLKNRISKGVCPCCNRYFAAVHEHIAKEHPEYVVPE